MHVRLKGVNRVVKKLADGSRKEYYYAWKGGPRLEGRPGTPNFIASFNRAAASRVPTSKGKISWLIEYYLKSPDYEILAKATKKEYTHYALLVEKEFGNMPISALADRRVRTDFLEWRDIIAKRSLRRADLAFAVLARIISFGYNRGVAPANPCLRPGRLYKSSRAEIVWTEQDEATFYEQAPRHLHLGLTLALWTGQRQGDLLGLIWAQYDGATLRFKQQKTTARVLIPVSDALRQALDVELEKAKRLWGDDHLGRNVLLNHRGAAWTQDGFRASWNTACKAAGITGKTFHDLRGTAVTRLALAGCTEAEIASITGHSIREVGTMLQRHYLKFDQGLAVSAIQKLEAKNQTPN